MAAGLHGLIRLHGWRVDEKRRRLGDLLQLLGDLEARARVLEDEIVSEQRVAAAVPAEGGRTYGPYALAAIERRERLAESIARTEAEVSAARNELRVAHAELRRYEIAQENRDRQEIEDRDRRERILLDDVGLQQYVQRHR